jgi:hypothetical protein
MSCVAFWVPGPWEIAILLVIVLPLAVAYWKPFSKAGCHGAWGLLLFVPLINFVVFMYLCFAKWPVLRELEALKLLTASIDKEKSCLHD